MPPREQFQSRSWRQQFGHVLKYFRLRAVAATGREEDGWQVMDLRLALAAGAEEHDFVCVAKVISESNLY